MATTYSILLRTKKDCSALGLQTYIHCNELIANDIKISLQKLLGEVKGAYCSFIFEYQGFEVLKKMAVLEAALNCSNISE